MNFTHDCNRHHLGIPDDNNVPFIPTPRSHNAEVLLRAVQNIIDMDPQTFVQGALVFDFLAEYEAADCDKMTYAEMKDFLQTMLVAVDLYFFNGALTQGEQRHVMLELQDNPLRHVWGHWTAPLPYLPGRITIFLRTRTAGVRRSKIHLLTTLVHEMVHAYCGIFFNFCPEENEEELVLGYLNDGHGELWQQIYEAIYTHMRTWDACLAGLEKPVVDPAPAWLDPLYYRCVQRLPCLRRAWAGTDLRPQEPAELVPWPWKPRRKEMFKRALLRLSHIDYEYFVATKVPLPVPVWRMIQKVGLALIVALCLAYYVVTGYERILGLISSDRLINS